MLDAATDSDHNRCETKRRHSLGDPGPIRVARLVCSHVSFRWGWTPWKLPAGFPHSRRACASRCARPCSTHQLNGGPAQRGGGAPCSSEVHEVLRWGTPASCSTPRERYDSQRRDDEPGGPTQTTSCLCRFGLGDSIGLGQAMLGAAHPLPCLGWIRLLNEGLAVRAGSLVPVIPMKHGPSEPGGDKSSPGKRAFACSCSFGRWAAMCH